MPEPDPTLPASRNGRPGAPAGAGWARSLPRRLRPRPVVELARRARRGVAAQRHRGGGQRQLDERDPDYIRRRLPGLWLLASLWFRGEVRGLGNVPEHGPVLLVANQSGGRGSPDTGVLTLAFAAYFGVERALYALTQQRLRSLGWPALGPRFGIAASSAENVMRALARGAAVLVYPGGEHEAHRPSWKSSRVEFAGHKDWVRVALEQDLPVVPVIAIGGQETALFLARGDLLARRLGLHRLVGVDKLPISLGIPWGLDLGDWLARVPLPAKITIEVLPALELRREFGPDPDLSEIYDHVTQLMQDTLDALAAERRVPLLG